MASFKDMNTQAHTFDRYVKVHETPTGPGDARPTAIQIIQDNALEGKLADKVMLVTGASTGIGVDTTRALAATGARVFLLVRDLVKGQRVIEDIAGTHPISKGKLDLIKIDLASLDSVRAAAKDILSKTDKLHVMVNNAGIAGSPKGTTTDGFDTMLQVNYLAPFLLFQILKPLLLSSVTPTFHSRVVNVSSLAHRHGTIDFTDINHVSRPYNPLTAYGASKTAMNWMAVELERRYSAQGLHAIAIHPGGMAGTNLLASHSPEFIEMMKGWMAVPGIMDSFKSNEQGAATTVLAAVDKELEGKGGIYLDDCGTYGVGDDSEGAKPWLPGYAPWTFDEDSAKRMWVEGCKMVKVDA